MREEPRAETVGSLLRTAEVVRAARGADRGAAVTVLDAAVLEAVRLQEELGLDVITDGEVRRTSWAQTPRFVGAFAATPGRGQLNWRGGTGQHAGSGDHPPGASRTGQHGGGAGTMPAPGGAGTMPAPGGAGTMPAPGGAGTGSGYPAVVRRVADAPRTGSMAGEYAFLARHARSRTKFTMAAPSYHRRYWSAQHSTQAYRDCAEFLTDIRDYQRGVVAELIGLGCDYIQLDAPNYGSLCDPDYRARMRAEGRGPEAETVFDAELDNSLFAGISGITRALHICRGNGPAGMWHSAGGYGAISRQLFGRLQFDRLLLEYDSGRAGTFEPLADVRPGTIVVLGLLTTKSDHLEDMAEIGARIDEAARVKPLAELALSTQCGFASVPGSNPVSAHGQRAKLELVARIAQRTWPG
jgi:5-methyltetrahydropteroyltriglutamate--homocysteine methyltransferase